MQVDDLAPGENVTGNEQALGVALHWGGARDAVIQEQAFRSQKSVDFAEIRFQVRPAHLLEHTDRRDLVELAHEIAIIHLLNGDLVFQARGANTLAGVFELPAAQGAAVGGDAPALSRLQDEGAPTAADVEVTIAGLQTQLSADVIQLRRLRLVERSIS